MPFQNNQSTNNQNPQKQNRNNILIRFTRDSVSMGDDCMAPHKEEILFGITDTWLDLLNAAAKYVPSMYDCEWEVLCGAKVLGTLISGNKAEYRVEAKQANAFISTLPEREVFCRKKEKIEHLSYSECLEVLYDGVYFTANCFREYGNVGRIMEEEETKITTQDKEFAIKHGFEPREPGHYDKILLLDQFEGLRVRRIPNDPNAEVILIDISKDKIMEELKKRAKSPHDMITDGVLAYGVNVGRLVFEEEGYIVYAISDLPHIGPSDVFMVYQITKDDYEKLLDLSCTNRVPQPSISSSVTNACRKEFLCGESAYCKRYYCTLDDVDMSLAEKIDKNQTSSQHPGSSQQLQPEVMNYCPECGKKNTGDKYCRECGTKLIK